MSDSEHPIDVYLSHLARRLHLPAAERDQVLAELRGHLEERARVLHESGVVEEHAEQQALQAFGPVGRISRELRATHPIAWGKRRWLVGLLMGALVPWAVYLVGTVPFVIYYHVQHMSPPQSPPLLPLSIPLLPLAWAQGIMVYYVEVVLGWAVAWRWLIVLYLVLYPVVPLVWGRRAQHWWVPGLAYGLGTGLLIALHLLLILVPMWVVSVQLVMVILQNGGFLVYAWMLAVSLPLALAASFLGWWWRERSVAALARAQAA